MKGQGTGVTGQENAGFRRLLVWQNSYELVLLIYRLTADFPVLEEYGLKSQLRRSIVSLPANIAEGYERNHRKEYVQFLHMAKGSLGEAETYLSLSKDLGYFSTELYEIIEGKRSEVGRMLKALIKSLT